MKILKAENITDLYILSNIIESGDIVSAKTTRRIRSRGKEGREGDKGERITLFLGVSVEEVHFQESSVDQRLRVRGRIALGPEEHIALNSNHTLNISIHLPVTIQKPGNWNIFHKKLLKDAEKASQRPQIGVVAIEPGLATIGIINNFKINQITQERFSLPRKLASAQSRETAEYKFFKRILSIIQIHFQTDVNYIVIGGPGNTKNSFYKYTQEEWRKHDKTFQLENLSSGSSNGLNEILHRKTLDRLISDYQIYKEFSFLDEFEKRLGKDITKVAYSLKDVYYAIKQGAVETVLVNDTLIRTSNPDQTKVIKKIFEEANQTKASLFVVDSKSSSGRKLKNFGDIIGLLRYSVYLDLPK